MKIPDPQYSEPPRAPSWVPELVLFFMLVVLVPLIVFERHKALTKPKEKTPTSEVENPDAPVRKPRLADSETPK